MKSIPADYTATLVITVSDAMTVNFGELGALHPVYATYEMARHFEEAGRKVLLPHLEPGEEGIGSSVSVEHTASALVGMQVFITASFERLEGRRLYCSMMATNELGDEIGRGSSVQVILPRTRLEQGFAELETRWAKYQETQHQERG